MIPDFEILGKTFSVYQITGLFGVLAFLFFVYRAAKKLGLDEIKMLCAGLVALFSSLIGSHLLYGITMWRYIRALATHPELITSFSAFIDFAKLIFGGSVFYGGLISGLLGGYIYYRRNRLSASYADIGACAIPLLHFFGRVGCFLGGCCYGIECSFGIAYTDHPDPSVNGITRFPVQLLEAGFNLCLFLLLLYFLRSGKYKGKLMLWYLIAYPAFRFCDEFLRGDAIRGGAFGLSTSQIISLLILLCVVPFAIIRARRDKRVI